MIKNATGKEYNGVFTISNVLTNSYDYTVTGTPTSPDPGSPTSTVVILDGTTDSNGEIKDTTFVYTSDQPVAGHVRKGTAVTYYKNSPLVGSILVGGYSATAVMLHD